MARTKISEYSSIAADNTDISNINIAEGCSPSNLNNALRTLMAQLKDQQAGTSNDNFTVAGTLAVTGGLTLDGAAGTSGQALTSAGSGNTPTWSTLGTMASQSASAVNITGGTISGTGVALSSNNITNSGGWSVTPSGTTLFFNYNGTNVAKLDSSGNLTVKANVTAYGTV